MAEVSKSEGETVLEAVLSDADEPFSSEFEKNESNRGRRQLNFSAVSTVAISIVFLLLAMTFGESMIKSNTTADYGAEWWETPLQLRHTMELPMDTLRAQLPVNGTYEALPYTEHFIEVELPASEQDVGFPGPALMHIALWLPNVPEGETVPVS